MAENIGTTASAGCGSNRFKEAVCIEAGRIFDSCSDKDCLEDLQVFFGQNGREIILNSTIIKCKSAEILDVVLTVEPVPFNKGFFAVDLTFYFRVQFSTYESKICTPVNVYGLAWHSKKVILYGSEGSVKTFSSNATPVQSDCCVLNSNLPVANVKVVDPIVLGCRIIDCLPAYSEPMGIIPEEIAACFDDDFTGSQEEGKTILVTLGMFTIVTLQRDVQLMIPAYDYVLPEKDCITSSVTPDDPCEMFKRIKFPVNEFFPDDLCEVTKEDSCN